jgi:CheY-like chemotaxis protein
MTESSKTILVVEDDREVREIALAVLEDSDYRVMEAATGDAAYRLLLSHPELEIDVLFTDVVMPGRLDGIDLAVLARELRPDLAVLFASGFASLLHADRERTAIGPVLHKPYRPAELLRALSKLFADAD